jgi:hypothetical protein
VNTDGEALGEVFHVADGQDAHSFQGTENASETPLLGAADENDAATRSVPRALDALRRRSPPVKAFSGEREVQRPAEWVFAQDADGKGVGFTRRLLRRPLDELGEVEDVYRLDLVLRRLFRQAGGDDGRAQGKQEDEREPSRGGRLSSLFITRSCSSVSKREVHGDTPPDTHIRPGSLVNST